MIQATVAPRQLEAGQAADLTVRLRNTGVAPCTNLVFRLGLPEGLVLLSGADLIEAARLDAGESASCTVRVRPRAAGRWTLTSPNFSYEDPSGRSRRVDDLRLDVRVLPAASRGRSTGPDLLIELETRRLPLGRWERLEGWVVNGGGLPLQDVEIRAVGTVRSDRRHPWHRVGRLEPGERGQFRMPVRADEQGGEVPLHLVVRYVDGAGSSGERQHSSTISIVPDEPSRHGGQGPTSPVRVLFLAAQPGDMAQLRSDREWRTIGERLRLSEQRHRIKLLSPSLSVRPLDVTQALLDHRPHIVHFSGHGLRDGALCFEDEAGQSHPADPLVLARMFALFTDHVRCVVMNACYSAVQAAAIADHVDYVVGVRGELGDRAALAFAGGFYQALGAGDTFDRAHELGCVQIGLHRPDDRAPILITRRR